MDTVNDAEPFGKIFADLARDYVAVLSRRLDDLPIERYWWPLDIIDRHDGTLTQRELASRPQRMLGKLLRWKSKKLRKPHKWNQWRLKLRN